jgi:hypothetical protein
VKMKTCILALELVGIAINVASSFQPVPFLPRHQFVPPIAQRGKPLHVQELTQLLAFDVGDAVVSAAAAVGAVIAASIVSREIAAASRKVSPVLQPNHKHFLPIPPKETPSLKLLDIIDVKEEVRTIAAPVVEDGPPTCVAKPVVLEPVVEQVVVEPERSIVGVPYVSDSLVDNVHDYLEAIDESEMLIVDPLVLNDYQMDPVLDNPLLYEGGYFEDEEEELFGVYERVAVDEEESMAEEEFGTFGIPKLEAKELATFPDVAAKDANDDILSGFDPNRPLGTSSESSQTFKRPVSYLETLAANTMSVEATPDPSYLDGLSKPNIQEEPPIDQDSIAGVPYVSDSLVDAVEDGLIIVDSEERLTVDPLALSRMNEGDSFVELYEKAEPIVAQYDNSPVPEETQIEFAVDGSEAVMLEAAAIVSDFVVDDATTAPVAVSDGFPVEDSMGKSDTVSISPDQGQLQVQSPIDKTNTNGIIRSTNVAGIVSLQEGDGLFDAQESIEDEIPRPQLQLTKSSSSQNPSLQRVQVMDPKLDAVRKQLQEKAINMTNALLQKSEQQSQVIQRTPRDFEEATEREQTEQNMSSQVTEQVLILEKEVDKKNKPLLNLEKGSGKQTSSAKTVISFDKGGVNQKIRKGGVLRSLRQKKVVIAVSAMAVVVARRVILSIISRGIL